MAVNPAVILHWTALPALLLTVPLLLLAVARLLRLGLLGWRVILLLLGLAVARLLRLRLLACAGAGWPYGSVAW